ncbi:MAG TPA: methylmalonyl-CoA mutase family protein, partial [Gaiellaceae bacterium]|nr:methylmalonyl-CoA mutase family protein [Gaiellaceae bacterium]
GFIQGQIEAAAFEWTSDVEAGRRPIVGVNTFVEEEGERIELHRIDPESEREQVKRTQGVRAARDAAAADAALARVREVSRGTDNLLPSMREALVARCTVGEICGVLRDEWGMHDH